MGASVGESCDLQLYQAFSFSLCVRFLQKQLNDMGLVDRERNLELLRQHRGDMNEVCATLFGERMGR